MPISRRARRPFYALIWLVAAVGVHGLFGLIFWGINEIVPATDDQALVVPEEEEPIDTRRVAFVSVTGTAGLSGSPQILGYMAALAVPLDDLPRPDVDIEVAWITVPELENPAVEVPDLSKPLPEKAPPPPP